MAIFLSREDFQYEVSGGYIPAVKNYHVAFGSIRDTKTSSDYRQKLLELHLSSDELLDLVNGLLDILENNNYE